MNKPEIGGSSVASPVFDKVCEICSSSSRRDFTYSLAQRTALANGNPVTLLNTESRGDVSSQVLVTLLVTVVLGDVVKVFTADDDGTVHLGGDDTAGKDTATDRDLTGEGALLVCRFYISDHSKPQHINHQSSKSRAAYSRDREKDLATAFDETNKPIAYTLASVKHSSPSL